jgi:hypothetical protein
MTVFPAVSLNPKSEIKDVAYALAAGPRCVFRPHTCSSCYAHSRPAAAKSPCTLAARRYIVTLAFFPTSALAKPPGSKLRWAAVSTSSKMQQAFDINTQTRMKQPGGGQLLDTQDGRTTQVTLASGRLYSGARAALAARLAAPPAAALPCSHPAGPAAGLSLWVAPSYWPLAARSHQGRLEAHERH